MKERPPEITVRKEIYAGIAVFMAIAGVIDSSIVGSALKQGDYKLVAIYGALGVGAVIGMIASIDAFFKVSKNN